MIILPKSIFYHVPKTGGSWIAEGINASFKEFEVPFGYGHASPKEYDPGDKPSFCFVRNPLTWYRSYANSTGEDVTSMVESSHYTKLLKTFGEVTYFGRFESLQDDLRRILDSLEEVYDKGNMFDRPQVNASRGEDLSDELKHLITAKEKWVFKEFNYERY